MNKKNIFRAIIVFMTIIICFAFAQDIENKLTLERLYKDYDFRLKRFGPAKWLEDHRHDLSQSRSIHP